MLRASEIVAKSGYKAKVFALKYSLAPEANFPRQQQEAIAAYRYLIEDEKVDPQRTIISGGSADCHLALSCLLGMDLPRPGGALLLCPWTNLRCSGAEFEYNKFKDILEVNSLEWWGVLATGNEASHLVNLSTSPKPNSWGTVLPSYTLVNAGSHEILLDETEVFVKGTDEEGADVDLKVSEGMCYSWQVTVFEEMQSDFYNPEKEEYGGKMLGSENIGQGILRIIDELGLGVLES